ncbi:signal peptidase I, partial [Candidatus Sumerlaeota bacterium]|nr:signal peptidase I [Candidatus Sumerlaeota bacterium]
MREWSDALVIAFLLAMFIRTFVVELFKIPSGSMTPTLIGSARADSGEPRDLVMEWDVDNNGEKDLIIDGLNNRARRYHVFYRRDGKFVENKELDELPVSPHDLLQAQKGARLRNDRIVVNKFIYWLRHPRRGEIVVFRVPESIWDRDKPIYIKRCVGLPGDLLEIRSPRVFING